jgi:hypothetical protein
VNAAAHPDSVLRRWTDKVSGATLWAIAVTLAVFYLTLGFLAINTWQNAALSLQVVNLIGIGIAFAVLVWGFWGAAASTTAACLTTLAVTVVAGRLSLESHVPFARSPFIVECLMFCGLGWLCLRFLEREAVEEIADRRQLERLEEEYLELAIQFGKREELHKVLLKKQERVRQLEAMGARLRGGEATVPEAVQLCLNELIQVVGKGEAEVILYTPRGVTRHPKGGAPMEIDNGRDEIDRWLEEHRTALLVNNLTHDVRFTQGFGKTRQIVSLVAVPLTADGELRGTLRLTSVVPQAFTHEDLRFASEAASLLLPLVFRPG